MTRPTRAPGELPFDHELIEPLVATRTDTLIYWCAVTVAVALTTMAVMTVAGVAGYIYTRWLA